MEADCHLNSYCSENRSVCYVITVSVGGGQEGAVVCVYRELFYRL